MKTIAFSLLAALALLACPARSSAQGVEVVGFKGIALGYGSVFAEETTMFTSRFSSISVTWEGIVLPVNETSTGIRVEVGLDSFRGDGPYYKIYSRNRTKIAGPTYGGVDLKYVAGRPANKLSDDFDVTGFLGTHLGKIGGRVLDFEVSFLEETEPPPGAGPAAAAPIPRPVSWRLVYQLSK